MTIMINNHKNRTAAGMTLVEIVVASAILFIGILAALTALKMMNDSYTSGISDAKPTEDARRVLDRMSEDLFDAAVNTMVPAAPVEATEVTFQKPTGYDPNNGGVQYGDQITWRWELNPRELDNGADDDGDGMADNGRVIREENGVASIISENVEEDGFVITLENQRTLTVTLRTYLRDETARPVRSGGSDNRPIHRKVITSSVQLRN